MNQIRLMPLIAASIMVSATASFAQTSTPPAGTVEQPTAPHSSGSGTAPEGKGSTGWTGGARDQSSQTVGQPTSAKDAEAAKDQPPMASGEDLKGPTERFPPSKTPE